MASSAEADTLTGVWHGQYAYPMALEPVHFVATLIDSGGAISGSTHETTGRPGEGSQRRLAIVEGARDGANVRFVKIYAPASADHQDVIYTGALNADRSEIEGTWMIPGDWSGRFLMIRSRGTAAAVERREEITV